MRFRVLFPNICTGQWVSDACISLAEAMAEHCDTKVFCHTLERGFRSPVAEPAIPPWLNRLAWRVNRHRPFVGSRCERRFLAAMEPGDVAWIWPGEVLETVRKLKCRAVPVVLEATNCHQATTRRILNAEYVRLGMRPSHGITDAGIAYENALLREVDYVFCQSPLVAESLLDNGVDESKLIRSSVGWSPKRFGPGASSTQQRDQAALNIVFAGTLCVRKGPHLLARAWRDAACPGRLQFAGRVSPEFAGREPEFFAGPGIELLGHRNDLPSVMGGANVFALPTLEEGGPMVTYEAAAMGLAIVTTPMGAGTIIRDGVDGIVLDPSDHESWVQAIRRLSAESGLRARLGAAARERAQEFTWDKVAQRRLEVLSIRRHSILELPCGVMNDVVTAPSAISKAVASSAAS